MNTKQFQGFVIKINTFHATECHLNPTQKTKKTAISHFVLLGFNLEKFEKVFNLFVNYSIKDF